MKKLNVALAFFFVCIATFFYGQDSMPAVVNHIPDLVSMTSEIFTATNNDIIPGVNNTITGAVIGVLLKELVAGLIRRRRKKKAAKKSQVL